MTITDRDRRHLYDGLEANLGAERADVLMQLLPTQPANELVTISYFQTEMGALRSELRGEMAELRGEMAELRGEVRAEMGGLRGEMGGLRGEMQGDMGRLRADVTSQMADMKSGMNRWAAALLATNTIALVTALLT